MAKYASVSVSGYNATPPADDGTVAESNKIKWSTIKTKITDPLNTAIASINTNLVSAADLGPTVFAASDTLSATHYGDFIQVSGSGVTLTLTDAGTLAAGWHIRLRNTDSSNSVTIGRATGADTINGTAANITIAPGDSGTIFVNAAESGFFTDGFKLSLQQNHKKSVFTAEGANVASASDCDIWSVGDGNTVHVTGTTTITDWGTAPQAGAWMRVIFDGALTLTHNATTNDLPGDANMTTVAGDTCIVYAVSASAYKIVDYQRATKYGQVAFPATQNASSDANTLDDYEEGTWTPAIGGTATYTTQSGHYTKIGNLVCVRCQLDINVIGTGSTTTVSGLPFAAANNVGVSIGYFNNMATALVSVYGLLSTSSVVFRGLTAAGVTIGSPAVFGDGAGMYFTATYLV